MHFNSDDVSYMQRALELARHAENIHSEVPVGAVLVRAGVIVGEGFNQSIGSNDPSAHAEVMALRDAGRHLSNYRFPDATLYVTLEPCVMCSGALVHARIARVVYAAPDPKTGAAGSVFDTLVSPKHNHHISVECGLLESDSSALLRGFFKQRRAQGKSD